MQTPTAAAINGIATPGGIPEVLHLPTESRLRRVREARLASNLHRKLTQNRPQLGLKPAESSQLLLQRSFSRGESAPGACRSNNLVVVPREVTTAEATNSLLRYIWLSSAPTDRSTCVSPSPAPYQNLPSRQRNATKMERPRSYPNRKKH